MLCFAQRCQSAPGFILLPNSSCWTCYLGLAFLLPLPPTLIYSVQALLSKIFLDLYSIELNVMQDTVVNQQHELYGGHMGFSAFSAFFFSFWFHPFSNPRVAQHKIPVCSSSVEGSNIYLHAIWPPLHTRTSKMSNSSPRVVRNSYHCSLSSWDCEW